VTALLENPTLPATVEPTPAQVMQDVAETLADPSLIDAVESFLAMHEAAAEAWERAHLTDAGGWGGCEDEAERLSGEAKVAWMKIAVARSRHGLFVADEVLEIGVDYYVGRHRFTGRPVAQSGPCDWSIGRAT
jgi:hypothetical protein